MAGQRAGGKHGHVGNVARRGHAAQRGLVRVAARDVFQRQAARLRLGGNHIADARAVHGARQDGVHPDAVGAQLQRQRLGQADHRPLGRRIGRAARHAQVACRRRQVDDGRLPALACRLPKPGHGQPRAQEGAGDVHIQRALPVGQLQRLHRARGAGHPGVVDEDVQAAQLVVHGLEQGLHLQGIRHIGKTAAGAGQGGSQRIQAGLGHVTDHDARAGLGKGAADFQADSGGARRHQDALAGQKIVFPHAGTPWELKQR